MLPIVTDGGVSSVTRKETLHVFMLPTASLTVTRMVVVPRPTWVPAVGTCVMISDGSGVQLSCATIMPITLGTAAMHVGPAEACCGEAQVTIEGASASTAVTVKVQVAVLPQSFIAVQVTVVGIPTANVEPETGEQFTMALPLQQPVSAVG